MAPKTKGRLSRPKSKVRDKKEQGDIYRHRFQSFTQRIANISIDPIRSKRQERLEDESEVTSSYFRTSLERWEDVNLSGNFTDFANKVRPLSTTLPQIVHHEKQIHALLLEHIGEGDILSLEPLLSLVSGLARDLGVRFQTHFPNTVEAVSGLVLRHNDVEVIEWSFMCLAWMFKFLSRVLVEDLKSVFDLMQPLLGASHNKPFLSRFAAEALSYLIRKAASNRNEELEALSAIAEHSLKSAVATNPQSKTFQGGLIVLYVEAIRGIQNRVYLHGPSILHEVAKSAARLSTDDSRMQLMVDIVSGIIVELSPELNAEAHASLISAVFDVIQDQQFSITQWKFFTNVLFSAIAVCRDRSEIKWNGVFRCIDLSMSFAENKGVNHADIAPEILGLYVIALQRCPLETMASRSKQLDRLIREPWAPSFVAFCEFFADFGIARFESFFLALFQKFVTEQWSSYETGICAALLNILPQLGPQGRPIVVPQAWKNKTRSSLNILGSNEGESAQSLSQLWMFNGFLELPSQHRLALEIDNRWTDALRGLLLRALEQSEKSMDADVRRFSFGNIHKCLLSVEQSGAVLGDWGSICEAAPTVALVPSFWDAMSSRCRSGSQLNGLSDFQVEQLAAGMKLALSAPSRPLRVGCLETLGLLCKTESALKPIIDALQLIESSPVSIDTSRAVGIPIRKLGTLYNAVSSHSLLGVCVPAYCFGLLTVHLTPIWMDVLQALEAIVGSQPGERLVSQMAFEWLGSSPDFIESETDDDELQETSWMLPNYGNTFLERVILSFEKYFHQDRYADKFLRALFRRAHTMASDSTISRKEQALRIFNAIPNIAEKRSRDLVPLLMKWAETQIQSTAVETIEDDNAEQDAADTGLGFKERKSLLSLFSKFKNPKALYQSTKVHGALSELLTVGNSDIQESAMKALMTWRSPGLVKHEEALFDLIDDAKFKDRITIFLGSIDDDSALQPADRPVVMPILLRLLYGKAVTKTGTRSAANRPENKRRAIFGALTRFPVEDLREYIRICFGPLKEVRFSQDGEVVQDILQTEVIDIRRQQGVLTMLRELLAFLGSSADLVAVEVVEPVLYCLLRSYPSSSTNPSVSPERQKMVRSLAYKCLSMVFEHGTELDWTKYLPLILDTALFDRKVNFAAETAQSISGLLQLVGQFYRDPRSARFLCQAYPGMLLNVAQCLTTPNAKAEVQIFVLARILDPLAEIASGSEPESEEIRDSLLRDVDAVLDSISATIEKEPELPVLEACLNTLVNFSNFIRTQKCAAQLVTMVSTLLEKPKAQLNQRVKVDLLKILHHFIPQAEIEAFSAEFDQIYRIISSAFGESNKPEARLLMCDVIDVLSQINPALGTISTICRDLNSVGGHAQKLGLPNFEKRLEAYHQVNETLYISLTALQWLPILYNGIHFLKVPDELSIRASASLTVRRFIEVSSAKSGEEYTTYQQQVERVILPDLIKGLRSADEQVRAEFVGLVGVMVAKYPSGSSVSSLSPLLMGGDEEASVFANILHIQHHRRLRAMRRLAEHAQNGTFTSFVVSQVLIPLMESFVLDKNTDENHHNLVIEAITTIKSLAPWLAWSQMRAILRKHCGRLKGTEARLKTIARLISSYLDALCRAAPKWKKAEDTANGDVDMSDAVQTTLTNSITSPSKFRHDISEDILPPLFEFLHKQDEDTVQARMIVAPCCAKTVQLLTEQEFEQKLVVLLSEVCVVLRSKSPETRDTARKAIAEIVMSLGPQSVGFVLRSLKSSLQRGYQRHVFSYTMHTILVELVPTITPGDLDYCIVDLVEVMMDSTFGSVGEEKDAEEYVSRMKEVKSNKSFDAMDLVSKVCTQSSVAKLIRPIRMLLTENLPISTTRKVDEFLRRIGLGIMQNPALADTGILVFCYELFQQSTRKPTNAPKVTRLYKLVRFGLDLLRSIFHKHPSLKTPQNLSGLLPPICGSILASHEEVQMSAMRLAASIITVPLPRLVTDAPVFVAEAVRIVEAAPSTGTELSQAALKLIVAVLKDRKDVTVKEKHIAHIIKRIRGDLEEPERQGSMFSLLKSVISRKMVMPELYEAMETVARIMITNQTRSTRATARSTYFQFLTDCPQSKDRFTKQIQFLVKNFQYQYEEGRESVMELMHLVLTKLGDDLVQQVIKTAFVPLVMVIINDESQSCRAMAGILMKETMQRADTEQWTTIEGLLQDWLKQDQNDSLRRAALQIWSIWFEVLADGDQGVGPFVEWMADYLNDSATMSDRDNWETIYLTLQTFEKLCAIAPKRVFAPKAKPIWENLQQCLRFPHQWVKGMAAKLIGLYLAEFLRAKSGKEMENVTSVKIGEDELIGLTKSHLKAFESPEPSDELLKFCSQNLLALTRLLDGVQVPIRSRPSTVHGDDQASQDEKSDMDEDQPSTRSTSVATLVFSRLARVVRRTGTGEIIQVLRVKKAVIDLIAVLSENLETSAVAESVDVFLPALYNMTDTDIPKTKSLNAGYNQLLDETTAAAQEIMSGLQKQLGTTEYVRHYQKAKDAASQRREERRVKRKLEAVNNPEAYERMKRKKREASKARQKEINMEHRGRRRGW